MANPVSTTDAQNPVFSGIQQLLNWGSQAAETITAFNDSKAARELAKMQAATPEVVAAPTSAQLMSGDVAAIVRSNIAKVAIGGGLLLVAGIVVYKLVK